jgi:hypothetical protein
MRCPNCGTGVEQGVTQCPQCEIAVAWEGDTATFHLPQDDVPVFTATDPAMLPVIESLLDASGIPYVVSDDVSQDFMSWGRLIAGYSPVTGPPVVRVPAEHAEAARELIASARVGPAAPDEESPPE